MTVEEFKDKFKLIHKQMETELSDIEGERFPIYDGPVSCEKYFNSPIKIVWLLKEAYDGEEGTGGGWTFESLLGSKHVYKDFIKSHPSRSTWHPIIYISYSLLNGFPSWNEMNYIRDMPEMCFAIQEVAFINALKLPAMYVTKSYYSQMEEQFHKYKIFNSTQLELLDADIIIGASTLNLYKDILGISSEKPLTNNSIHYYTKGNKLIIDAYHPAQRSVSRERYVDDIILTVKNWHETNFTNQ